MVTVIGSVLIGSTRKIFRFNGRGISISNMVIFWYRRLWKILVCGGGGENQLAKIVNLKEMEKHGQVFADQRRAAPTRKESNSNTRPLSLERQKPKTENYRRARERAPKRAAEKERNESESCCNRQWWAK